ncbi:MAG TPA: aminomethyltransferase family protein, partial [Anaerolineales bacterium]|nr:aminomethyltransferase family protein [Anaerolineales bacterium]
ELACLALWGPKARHILQAVSSAEDVSNQAIPYLQAKDLHIQGEQVLAQRVSYIGELGWELYMPPERALQVWDLLMEAGEEYGLDVGGYKALDSLRLEKGYRYFTADITPMENPYEAGLGFCVQLEKGDFIGRAALQEVKAKGITRKLCTLTLEGEEFVSLYGGEAVYSNGVVVSRVRSGGYGYTLKCNILYAYLPLDLAHPGTRVQVEVFDQRYEAEVNPTVLYDPKGERLRA